MSRCCCTVGRNALATMVGPDARWGDHEEWIRAKASLSVLDGYVPYAITTGNLDHGDWGPASGPSRQGLAAETDGVSTPPVSISRATASRPYPRASGPADTWSD